MRRILIAALLGAPLLLATPAAAALSESKATASGNDRHGFAGGLTQDQSARESFAALLPEEAPTPAALQVAGDSNALWWLQLGVGNRWHDGHRHRDHRHRDWHKHDRWQHNHGVHRGHWRWHREQRHRHRNWHSRRDWRDDDHRWRRRDWDDDDRRWRHRDRDDDDDHRHRGRHDWDDDDRDYRWADGRYHR